MDGTIRTTRHGDLAVVIVTGEVDDNGAARLRGALLDLIDADDADILVDLSETTFMDSTAMGVLVAALRRLRELGRRLELVVTDERLLRTLRIAGLTRSFVIHPTYPPSLPSPPAGAGPAGDAPGGR